MSCTLLMPRQNFSPHRAVSWMVAGLMLASWLGCSPVPQEAQVVPLVLDVDRTAPVTGPAIDLVYGDFTHRQITIIFAEAVNDTALNPANYQVLNLTVESVARINARSVRLVTSEQIPLAAYPVRIQNIQNTAANPLTLISDTVVAYQAFPPVRFESDFSYIPPRTHQVNHTHVENGILKLTLAEPSQSGTFIMDEFDPGYTVYGFYVTFKARIGGGTGADGMSLSFGQDVPYQGISEEGDGTGLIISFDTWANEGEVPNTLEAKFNKTQVMARQVPALRTGNRFVEVSIMVHPGGLMDLVWDGEPIYRGLIAYTFPTRGHFVFGARTGGAHDNHWIDDLQIGTVLHQALDQTPPALLSACSDSSYTNVFLVFSEPVGASAEQVSNYQINGLSLERVVRLTPESLLLNTTAQQPGTQYTLTAQNIQDRSVPSNTLASASIPFTSPDPTARFFADFCSLPANAKIYGTARVEDGILKLTDTNFWKVGTLVLPRLDGNKTLQSFRVDFQARLSPGPNQSGKGLCFAFGEFPNARMGSEGPGTGLTVHFDLAQKLLHVGFEGTPITTVAAEELDTQEAMVNARIQVDADGTLDVIWGNKTLVSNVPAYLRPLSGRFAFSADTDANRSAHHWIDNLRVVTTPVPPDTTRPVLLSARALEGRPQLIELQFSEPLLTQGAVRAENYSLEPAVAILSAEQDADGSRVALHTAAPLQSGKRYTLSICDLRDRANTPNDLGPNLLNPNPTEVPIRLTFTGPAELGKTVKGFQDDFKGSERSSVWLPRGPGGDVYQQQEGVLKVGTAQGSPNHLLYNAPGYHARNQEVLARIRVKNLAPDNVARAGIGAAIPLSTGLGANLVLKDGTQASEPRHAALLHENSAMAFPMYLPWEPDSWVWLRLKNTNGVASAKLWPADGLAEEPEEMHVLAHGETTGGLAGITASVLGAAGEFEVDYILILADGLPEIVVDPEACRPVSTELSPIGIRLEQNELVLTWSGAAVLEESAQAEGPYSPVAGNPSSPYRAPVNGTRKFFRLKEAP